MGRFYKELEHRKQQVIDACKEFGPLTAKEINKIMKQRRSSEAIANLRRDSRISVDILEEVIPENSKGRYSKTYMIGRKNSEFF